jgi:hypothetical protein
MACKSRIFLDCNLLNTLSKFTQYIEIKIREGIFMDMQRGDPPQKPTAEAK